VEKLKRSPPNLDAAIARVVKARVTVEWRKIADAKYKGDKGQDSLSPIDFYMLSLVEKGAMKLPEEYVRPTTQ
jgi:hypothetical protein